MLIYLLRNTPSKIYKEYINLLSYLPTQSVLFESIKVGLSREYKTDSDNQ